MKEYTRYPAPMPRWLPALYLRLYRLGVILWYVWAVVVIAAALVGTAYLMYGLFWASAGQPDRVYQRDF